MALSKALTNSAAMRAPATLHDLVTSANEEITRANTETMFVTACLALLDPDTGDLSLCDAGHEKAAIVSLRERPEVPDLPILPPLGLMPGLTYETRTMRLTPGSVVVLISDGVTEAQNLEEELYGRLRLDGLLARLSADGAGPEEIVDVIRAEVEAHEGGVEPADDVTVLAVRWNGPPERAA
jgi:serine phosphatase RsbU (regulator of sigma subunit)